jgi:hypothetical protein
MPIQLLLLNYSNVSTNNILMPPFNAVKYLGLIHD